MVFTYYSLGFLRGFGTKQIDILYRYCTYLGIYISIGIDIDIDTTAVLFWVVGVEVG